MPHKIYPCKPLQQLAPNLWQAEGSLSIPVPRNMTVYRTAAGELVLYSVVALDEPGMQALEALGTPTAMVVPHRRHHMDLPFYKARYPSLRVFGPHLEVVNGVQVTEPISALDQYGIYATLVPGATYDDVVMELPIGDAGLALCLCELLGNIRLRGVLGFLLKLIGPPGGGFGLARAVRWREVRDRPRLRAWLEGLAARPELRMVLVGHGAAVTDDVQAKLARAASQA